MHPSSAVAVVPPLRFERTARLCRWFTRLWFRHTWTGWEHLPAGPCLLVGNHSGFGTADTLCLGGAWYERFGARRRAVGLTSDFIWKTPILGHVVRRLGALRARRETARQALAAGLVVLVFPGGEIDSCRPFYRPRSVDFGNRRGYARIALEAGVPIVPVATIGSHWTYPMLPGGRALARLGLRRFVRADAVPLPIGFFLAAGVAVAGLTGVLALPWLALVPVVALVPLPVRISSKLLPPIDVTRIALDAPLEDRVEATDAAVLEALRRGVGEMRHPRS